VLGLDEAVGGVGLSVIEEVLLFEQIGRRLSPSPFVAGVLAARLAASTASDFFGEIVDGSLMVGLGRLGDHAAELGETITGPLYVVDTGEADLVLIIGAEGAALVEAAGATRSETLHSLDPGVRISRRSFREQPALAYRQHASGLAELGTVLVAAALAGVAAAAVDHSVAHACAREQFGRLIGTYQSVKHRCADMAVRAEAARALTLFAAVEIAESATEGSRTVSSARTLASRAALANAAANILNHGAVGFTADHGAHRLLKRAHLLAETLGTIESHDHRVIAEDIGHSAEPAVQS
jgi:hypothetical protein